MRCCRIRRRHAAERGRLTTEAQRGQARKRTGVIPFTSNAAAPGNQIATLTVRLSSGLNAGTRIALSFDRETTILSNQAGTEIESPINRRVQLVDGEVMVGGTPTTGLDTHPSPTPAGAP